MIKKIFIIDDYERNLRLYKATFNGAPNLDIITERDGIKGLEMLKESNPDLIILDYKLTNITGVEICKELRKIEKFKDIPIIMVSSTPIEKDVDRATYFKEAGFNLYFSKPINIKKFREIIKNLLFK
ncbi:MAG: response regulator [Promethearchaeota archaeon]